VQFAIADVEEGRDVATQVQKRVQLDRCFGRAKWSPRKYRQAQVDRAGVQRIDGFFQIDSKRFVRIQTPRYANQRLRQVGIDPPIARLVGIGKRAARHAALNAHVIQLAFLRSQARLDVAQTFAIGQLSKRHAQILIQAGKALDLALPAVSGHAAPKCCQRQMLRDLCEHQLSLIHRFLPRQIRGQDGKSMKKTSNRDQIQP
jgi:hypothetical protein